MKYLPLLLIAVSVIACKEVYSQDTTYSKGIVEKGFLVQFDSSSRLWLVKPILRIATYENIENIPCSTVYYWSGNKDSVGMYSHSEQSEGGACGPLGFFSAYPSEYMGDSVVKRNCQKHSYGVHSYEYFIPPTREEKKKKKKLGEKYIMKEDEYFGHESDWKPYNPIIICG